VTEETYGSEYGENLATEDELEDAQDEVNIEGIDQQRDYSEDLTPAYEKKDDLFSLFWKMVNKADSSKIANLNKIELGMLNLSVRDCQKIALLADTLGHRGFAIFFRAQGELIASTSLSKEGFLPQIVVTSRRVRAKDEPRELPDALKELNMKKKRKLF